MTARPAYRSQTALAELQAPELFMITFLRLRASADASRWREGFANAGIGDRGVRAFDELYAELAFRLPRRSVGCGRLGDEEAQVLRVISLLQHRRYGELETLLQVWLPKPRAERLLAAALTLAEQLAEADLIIPLRQCPAAAIELLAAQLPARPRLMRVH